MQDEGDLWADEVDPHVTRSACRCTVRPARARTDCYSLNATGSVVVLNGPGSDPAVHQSTRNGDGRAIRRQTRRVYCTARRARRRRPIETNIFYGDRGTAARRRSRSAVGSGRRRIIVLDAFVSCVAVINYFHGVQQVPTERLVRCVVFKWRRRQWRRNLCRICRGPDPRTFILSG